MYAQESHESVNHSVFQSCVYKAGKFNVIEYYV